jgi:hypothetical protein
MMDQRERLIRLHDRATRGIPLSAEEQADLIAWYGEQDQVERDMLRHGDSSGEASTLQAELDAVLIQLAASSERVREVSAQNDEIRREIAALRRLLPLASSSRPE